MLRSSAGDSAAALRTLLILAAVLAAVIARYRPPEVRGAGAPPNEFSAARAEPVLAAVAGNGVPHPTGTAANAAVRAAIIRELELRRLRPVVESDFVCATSTCGTVHNIVARIPGRAPRQEIILAVHYDSVAAGPGAGDDAAGVAVAVEIGRALLSSPQLRDNVTILIDDGEEQGLLGALAFVRRHRSATLPRVVVNVEARGTSGPSLMFETSAGNSPFVHAARAMQRPVTNSIYYTIYQKLPNDTDLTVFKASGFRGVNFAFVGEPARYHTPRDSLEFLDRRSLQHHGENALAMIRALAAAPAETSRRDEVFFDVLTFDVVRWPAAASPLLAFAVLALLVAITAARIRPLVHVGIGIGVPILSAGVAFLLGFGVLHLLRFFGFPPVAWIAQPVLPRILFWSIGILTPAIAGAMLVRFRADAVARGTWITITILALVAALRAPGLSYPFLAGGIAAAIASLFPNSASILQRIVPVAAFALMTFPISWMLYDAMGMPMMPAVAALVALTASPLAADVISSGRRLRSGLIVLASAAVVAAFTGLVVTSPYSRATPRPLSIVHYTEDQKAQWLLSAREGELPAPLVAAARQSPRRARGFAWEEGAEFWSMPAPSAAPPPEVTKVGSFNAGANRVIELAVRSRRDASTVGVVVPRDRLIAARIDRELLRPVTKNRPRGAWLMCRNITTPPEGFVLRLELAGGAPLIAHLFDVTNELPQEAASLAAARGEASVPIQAGDRTVASRPIRID